MSSGTSQQNGSNGENGLGSGSNSLSSWRSKPFGFGMKSETDKVDSLISLPQEDRKNLLDEISMFGHAVLKRTNRPRSPGGTPVKTEDPSTVGDSMLQRALMTKFRSLHSTPLPKSSHCMQQECNSSMEFSNAWSDVNGSLVFEDPDITGASSVSGFTSNNQTSSTTAAGDSVAARKDNSAHNGSTAV